MYQNSVVHLLIATVNFMAPPQRIDWDTSPSINTNQHAVCNIPAGNSSEQSVNLPRKAVDQGFPLCEWCTDDKLVKPPYNSRYSF